MKSMTALDELDKFDLILVDAMNQASIQYYSKPLSFNGVPTGTLFGVSQLVLLLKKRYKNSKIVFLWEGRNSIRKANYPIYKSKRHSKDGAFLVALQHMQGALPLLGVYQDVHEGIEADDLAGYYSHLYGVKKRKKVLLVSNDKDWWQFVKTDNIKVMLKQEVYDRTELIDLCVAFLKKESVILSRMTDEQLRLDADRLFIYKILKGDPSDCISGVGRFPADEALKIAQKCKSVSELMAYKDVNVDTMSLVKGHYGDFVRNIDLIVYNPSWIDLDKLEITKPVNNSAKLKAYLEAHGIQSLLHQI